MNRGKIINIVAGGIDIAFAVLMFALIGLYFAQIAFVQEIYSAVLVFMATVLNPSTSDFASLSKSYQYIVFAILGLTGLLSLIFGSVTICKSRKSDESYFKNKGSFVTFTVFELLSFILFSALLIVPIISLNILLVLPLILPIILLSILVLRFVAIGFLNADRKKFNLENPVAK